jgi:soluble lytic murein transglycosylase
VALICATITHETARTWNPEVISFAGALGLMQIIPATGIFLSKQEGIAWTSAEEILFNPLYNVRLGCRYLDMLITDYGLEAGLAGYNGGDWQAKRWLRGGRTDSLLHRETANYVPSVLKIYREYRNTNL